MKSVCAIILSTILNLRGKIQRVFVAVLLAEDETLNIEKAQHDFCRKSLPCKKSGPNRSCMKRCRSSLKNRLKTKLKFF